MHHFTRRAGRFTMTFNAAESALLADLVGQVRTLLAGRRDQAPVDPLAELTGIAVGPSTPPADPALARLLPDFHRDDAALSAGLRVLREPEVVAAKDDAARALLRDLPASGGSVDLGETAARAWIVALNDVRLVFGVRLDITSDDAEPAAAEAGPDTPAYAMYAAYRWLSMVQESLVEALLEAHHDTA